MLLDKCLKKKNFVKFLNSFTEGGLYPRIGLDDPDRYHSAPPQHEDQSPGGTQCLLVCSAQDGDVRVHRADDDDESEHAGESHYSFDSNEMVNIYCYYRIQ